MLIHQILTAKTTAWSAAQLFPNNFVIPTALGYSNWKKVEKKILADLICRFHNNNGKP